MIPLDVMRMCEGRHILLGAVPQWNRTVQFDMSLRIGEKRVVVEVFWFFIVRGYSTVFISSLKHHYRDASSRYRCP